MYTAYKRQRKYKVFLRFLLFLIPVILSIFAFAWFILLRNSDVVTSSFNKEGAQVAVVKPTMKDYSNEYFKITLPATWNALGKQNPYSNQVYYEFQDSVKETSNRWVRVYVDVIPKDFALNRVLPITVVENKIVPGVISDDCTTFTGSPQAVTGKPVAETWTAKWQDVNFVCAMKAKLNYVGTASAEEGIITTFTSSNNTKHKYFFLYIDHNVRPDYSIFTDALKSFETT